MNKYMLIICLFALAFSLFAETTVPSGSVQGNWNLTGSPYQIMGNINIMNGTVLTIGPGVEVIFHGTYKLEVLGQLVCSGEEENVIVFTAQDTLMGWQSIRFNNSGGTNPASSFSYTEFYYGRAISGATPTDPMNCGGAVWAVNAGTLTFDHCKFRQCKSMGDGSALYAENTNIVMNNCSVKDCETEWFGAFCISNGDVNITNTEFVNNTSNVFGACMYLFECTAANINNCMFINSSAGAVAGIYCLYSPLVIKNSLFVGNHTDTGRGGAIGVTHGTTTITNCTFAENYSPMDGGAIWFNMLDAPPVITNSVFWDNLPDAISSVSNTYSLSYCSMQVPQGGPTNIWGNPQFTNPGNDDFTLAPTSPCIDTGTPDVTGLNLPLLDLAGLPRIADGNQDSVIRIDMGCYEMPAPPAVGDIVGQVTDMLGQPVAGAAITAGTASAMTNEWGLYAMTIDQGTYSVTCTKEGYGSYTYNGIIVTTGQTTTVNFNLPVVANSDQTATPAVIALTSYPNPFAGNTSINFILTKTHPVKLDIYNLKGQKVKNLIDSDLKTGSHSITWNGMDDSNLPVGSGIYLYRLVSGKEVLTGRLMKM